VYTSTALKPGTRVFLSHVEGTRTTEDYVALFSDVEHKRRLQSPLPVFTSDNWDPIKDALLRVYGVIEQPLYKGRGRKPLPRLVPPDELKYAQVCKKRKEGRLVEVVQQVVFGDPEEVMMLLGADQGGSINTAYVERINLTLRNSLARFIRRTMNFSKDLQMHSHAIDFFQAWYNLVKPHQSLRVRVDDGIRKWKQRTPLMAEGLTDHVWTLEELLTFKVPVQ
jgi:hypothetical protein